MRQALEFARMAEVGHMVPFHYDPTHTDDDLDWMFKEILSEVPGIFRYPGWILVAKCRESLAPPVDQLPVNVALGLTP